MNILSRFKAGAFAFPLAALVALGLIVISESSYQAARTSFDQLGEINVARLRLQTLLKLLVDAETGQRGYLLTSSQDDLRPYREALDEIAGTLGELQRYFVQRSAAGKQMVALRALVDKRLAELATTLRLHDAGQREAALELVQANFGKEQMDAIRAIAEQLLADESIRRDLARKDVYDMLLLDRIGVSAMTVLALLAFYVYVRQTKLLAAQRGELHRAAQAERDRLEAEVDRRTAQLTELARHLQTAREDERGRLARELHDELGALLTAAKLDVARIKTRIAAASPEASERIAHLNETLNSGIALKRRIIEDLRPSSLANLGLVTAIENLAREFEARTAVQLACTLQPVELPADSELTVYRLVQEALTNIAKYARARRVEVKLATIDGYATVEVRDDGVGFDVGATPASAHGLLGMRYRVEGEGGTLTIESAPGQGTRVAAALEVRGSSRAERRSGPRLELNVLREGP